MQQITKTYNRYKRIRNETKYSNTKEKTFRKIVNANGTWNWWSPERNIESDSWTEAVLGALIETEHINKQTWIKYLTNLYAGKQIITE